MFKRELNQTNYLIVLINKRLIIQTTINYTTALLKSRAVLSEPILVKVLYEVIMSPVAGAIIWWLKKAEPVSYQHRFTGGAVPPPGFISEERV
ncbi:hypothetical protein GW536_17595 (plasmid) [Piscirickettsia salmonis]|nr:hypothetical protein GW536_17595 [Piscirickettsia salmonis]